MNNGRTVFAQLIAHLSHVEFQRCVLRDGGDSHRRNLPCWDQYLAMGFAQFTYRESSRSDTMKLLPVRLSSLDRITSGL